MKRIDTLSYTESLNIPEGYVVEKIIATTYSLEPGMIYLLMTLTEPVEEEAFWDTLAMKKCIKDSHRLKIFYQEDKFSCRGSKIAGDFLQIIENCCIPIARQKYAFHPKVILAEYKKIDSNEFKQRLIVSSRNLTNSDFVECAIVLEGNTIEGSKKINDIDELIDYVNQNDWYYENQKVKICFQRNGNTCIGDDMQLFSSEHKKIIVSPFYSNKYFCKQISNVQFYRCAEIHAKIYFYEREQQKNILWIGSANCTRNGLNHNYECQVGIETEMTSEEFKDWIEEKNGKEFSLEESSEDESSSQKTEMDSFLDAYDLKLNVKKKDGAKNLYVCNIEILPKSGKQMNCDFIKKFEIKMLGGGKSTAQRDGEIEWEVIAKDISTFAVIRLLDGETNNQRMIKMIMNEESENIMKALLEERRKKLVSDSMKMILPTFKTDDKADDSDEGDGDDSSSGKKHARGISLNDGLYESLVKLYASGEKKLVQMIRRQICNNKEMYDENVIQLIKMVEWMDADDEK